MRRADTHWLAVKPLRFIGQISYGIYLWHPLCLILASVMFAAIGLDLAHLSGAPIVDAVLQTVLAGCVVTGVAALSYWILERPFLKLKTRFQ